MDKIKNSVLDLKFLAPRTSIVDNLDNVAAYYRQSTKYSSLPKLNQNQKMHGAKRVAAFCIMTAILPSALIILPLYLRHNIFADVIYKITESDIIEIRDGISSIFCQRHSLYMNTSFNAFQVSHRPEISQNRKHIRLKKSMSLPDDTMEYWGFFLLKGATVELRVCSRYNGSSILVVEGEQNLKTCGILDHNLNKLPQSKEIRNKVFVTFETAAEVIDSRYSVHQKRKMNDASATKTVYQVDNVEQDTESKSNHAGEVNDEPIPNQNEDEIKKLVIATEYINHHADSKIKTENVEIIHKAINKDDDNEEETDNKIRHRKHHKLIRKRKYIRNTDINISSIRNKRELIIDRKINHGGNANKNHTDKDDSTSVSSFENSLLTCYSGREILYPRKFPASAKCTDIKYLTEEGGTHMITKHNITADGYYYYIFYSDNDFVLNDIHAIFDIFKPTYQYANISDSKGCINSTTCSFPIHFLSDETVIVEVPTRDGIESEDDDITYLVSTCVPRVGVYIIFPIAVLFLILSCAFL